MIRNQFLDIDHTSLSAFRIQVVNTFNRRPKLRLKKWYTTHKRRSIRIIYFLEIFRFSEKTAAAAGDSILISEIGFSQNCQVKKPFEKRWENFLASDLMAAAADFTFLLPTLISPFHVVHSVFSSSSSSTSYVLMFGRQKQKEMEKTYYTKVSI